MTTWILRGCGDTRYSSKESWTPHIGNPTVLTSYSFLGKKRRKRSGKMQLSHKKVLQVDIFLQRGGGGLSNILLNFFKAEKCRKSQSWKSTPGP